MKIARANSSLFLIELVIVILFFSISAAISMRVFATAKQLSVNSDALSRGAIAAESAAECYKAAGGDLDRVAEYIGGERSEGELRVYYDKYWSAGSAAPVYVLTIFDLGGGNAEIVISTLDPETSSSSRTIFELTVKAVV